MENAVIDSKGTPVEFTSPDGTKAKFFAFRNSLEVAFYPPGKPMYSFPCNRVYVMGKNPKGKNTGGVIEPSGFYYQDKDKKTLEFVLATISYGGVSLDDFVWNGHFLAPLPLCPPRFLWGVKTVERDYSDVVGEDYFIFTFFNGEKDAYYARNHFLVLNNTLLLKKGDSAHTHYAQFLELNAQVEKGDWGMALSTARTRSKMGAIVSPQMLQAIDVEMGNYDEAVSENGKLLWSENLARSYESVGDLLITDGKIDEARSFYEKAVTNYENWIIRIKTMETPFLNGPPPVNLTKEKGESFIKQHKEAFAAEMNQETGNINRVQQKIKMIDDQK